MSKMSIIVRDTKSFILKSRLVHDDRYVYSHSIYVNSKTKLKVICKGHGVFEVTPNRHLSGVNCRMCTDSDRRLTTKIFKKRSKAIHNNFYSYANSLYADAHTELLIECPVHGEFVQLPYNHLRGVGCVQCSIDERTDKFEDFLRKARTVHGSVYEYSDYVVGGNRVIVTCRDHGDFPQRPGSHLIGMGCSKCAHDEQALNQTLTTDDFIIKAKSVHKDTYSYDNTEYVNTETDVLITCSLHGDFPQTPHSHLRGKGCWKCTKFGFNPDKPGVLYVIPIQRVTDNLFEAPIAVKFGISNSLKRRLKQHKDNLHERFYKFRFVYYVEFENGCGAVDFESFIKYRLRNKRYPIDANGFKQETIEGKYSRDFVLSIKRYLKRNNLGKLKLCNYADYMTD